MWMSVIPGATLVVIALFTLWAVVDGAERRRWELRRNLATLGSLGLEVEPEGSGYGSDGTNRPLRARISGSMSGVDLVLRNCVEIRRPEPVSDVQPTVVCTVDFNAALPDLVACKSDDVDEVMGPLPAVPRSRTGVARFDGAYCLFFAEKADSEGDFRTAPGTRGRAFAPPALLELMVDLDMTRIRVREGEVQLRFAPLATADLERALLLGAGVGAASIGRTVPDIAPGPRAATAGRLSPGHILLIGWATTLIWSFGLGAVVAQCSGVTYEEGILLSVALAMTVVAVVAIRALVSAKAAVARSRAAASSAPPDA